MNRLRFTFNILAAAGFILVVSSLAHAQATRTWVSGVGDDVNPCSRTAPCKTFAGAISKTFINGEIDCLDEGGFGVVTVTKSITLEGTYGGGFGSILSSGSPTGVLINLTSGTTNDPLQTVRLRNLALTGTGASGTVGTRTGTNGVRVLSASNVYIEHCVITDFSNRGISDERTTAGNIYISDTTVRNVAQSGIVIIPNGVAVKAAMDHVRSEGNGNAGFVIDSNVTGTISNSVAAGNAGAGFFAETTGATTKVLIESSVSSNNGRGIESGPGASDIVCSNVSVFNNSTAGLNFTGGTIHSFGNNKVTGNGGGGSSNGPFSAGSPSQQ